MRPDNFWRKFWIVFGGAALLCFAASSTFFFVHIMNVNAAAVGVSYDPSRDPFEGTTRGGNFSLVDGYVYRDALPLGLDQWAWDSTLDWNSPEQYYEGSRALKVSFSGVWGGMGMSGFSVKRSAFQSLSFAVYPDSSVADLYIEVYDSGSYALDRQSIGWYAQGGHLIPNQWNYITIPLSNLMTGSGSATVTGISISTTNPGTLYIDSIQFTNDATPHALWAPPQNFVGPPFNPFATSTPATLPYSLAFSDDNFSRWYAYYGSFSHTDSALIVGPLGGKNTDSLAIMRAGRWWSDYDVKTTLDWGITSVFSILMRFEDPSNYVSCSYSYYGQTVQIYDVHNGASVQIAQTPALPTAYEGAWQNVKLEAKVQGNDIICYANGERALSATIDDMPKAGTVGMEAWDQNSYSSPHHIKSLEVSPLLSE